MNYHSIALLAAATFAILAFLKSMQEPYHWHKCNNCGFKWKHKTPPRNKNIDAHTCEKCTQVQYKKFNFV